MDQNDSANQKPPHSAHQKSSLPAHAASLHFCCPALFLQVYPEPKNLLIALRLGVSVSQVQRWRHWPLKCERSKSCLLPRCTLILSEAQFKALASEPPAPAQLSDPPTPTEGTERSD